MFDKVFKNDFILLLIINYMYNNLIDEFKVKCKVIVRDIEDFIVDFFEGIVIDEESR